MHRPTLLAAVLLTAAGCAPQTAETPAPPTAQVRTLAGTGVSGTAGDNGPALEAEVGNPYGIEIGPDGALYICEVDTHRVRRLDLASGRITTVAGTGEKGYDGDGGPAVEAKLNEPYELRFDRDGNMLFVEMQNAVVRRVDRETGVITTIAGTGESGFSGDGGPATAATFNQPHSIAVAPDGAIYVADIRNHRVRRIDPESGIIDTFAGTGSQDPTPDGATIEGTPLNGPRTMAFGPSGDLFLALREGNAVYRIDMKAATLHHIAGNGEQGYTGDGGPAKQAALSGPKGISVGPRGGVYIADTESHTIRRIGLDSGAIETVVGDGTQHDGPDGDPLACGLARPHGVFVDSEGVVYIGDSENHRVRALK